MLFRKLFVYFCIVAIVGLTSWKLSEGYRHSRAKEQELLLTSDAGNFDHTVTIWGDDWLGYLIFKSRAMQDTLRKQRIDLKYELVYDFKARVQGLADGKCDFLAITADSYISNAKALDYPGVIIFLVDESYGGDAIIGGPKVKNLDDLNKDGIKGAFVGDSPSEFLLKSSMAHFHLDKLTPQLKGFSKDKEEDVYNSLANGSADFAVLWEPFTSKALGEIKGSSRLLDTKQAQGLVLDVTVASRDLISKDPDLVDKVTKAYFQALHHYLDHPDELRALAQAYSGQPANVVDQMLSGVKFIPLNENQSTWFGIASTGSGKITDSLQAISNILVQSGDFPSDPLNNSPYTIINSRVLGGLVNFQDIEPVNVTTTSALFSQLSDDEWSALPTTGTLIDDPINFPVGQADLDDDAKALLTEAAKKLSYYPAQRIMVSAQVSPGSDPAQDQALSLQRAQSVRDFLVSCGVDPNRIHAVGLGSANLPPKDDNESEAAWKRNCRHAKVYLLGVKS